MREVDIDSKKNVFSSRRDCVGIVSALIPRIESEITHRLWGCLSKDLM